MKITPIKVEHKLNKCVFSYLQEIPSESYPLEIDNSFTYDDFLSNKMIIILSIRRGLPYLLFDLIQLIAPFSFNDWADYLNISPKTLYSYKSKKDHVFKPVHSEKIIELAEVTKMGTETFGSIEKLKLWLDTPNYALGNLKPSELLKDSYGKELVLAELIRINHGILV